MLGAMAVESQFKIYSKVQGIVSVPDMALKLNKSDKFLVTKQQFFQSKDLQKLYNVGHIGIEGMAAIHSKNGIISPYPELDPPPDTKEEIKILHKELAHLRSVMSNMAYCQKHQSEDKNKTLESEEYFRLFGDSSFKGLIFENFTSNVYRDVDVPGKAVIQSHCLVGRNEPGFISQYFSKVFINNDGNYNSILIKFNYQPFGDSNVIFDICPNINIDGTQGNYITILDTKKNINQLEQEIDVSTYTSNALKIRISIEADTKGRTHIVNNYGLFFSP